MRSIVNKFIKLYDEMSVPKPNMLTKKALILFSSMTGNTSKVAQSLSQGLTDVGVETNIINIKNDWKIS